jgi:hypothetical protein
MNPRPIRSSPAKSPRSGGHRFAFECAQPHWLAAENPAQQSPFFCLVFDTNSPTPNLKFIFLVSLGISRTSQAWELDDADKAERLLRNLARRLDRKAPGVADSILEGLDEMLTVNRLKLPAKLRRSLAAPTRSRT